jgi:hypothetical protein
MNCLRHYIKIIFFWVITQCLVKIENLKPAFQDLLFVPSSGEETPEDGTNSKSCNAGFKFSILTRHWVITQMKIILIQ